MVPAWNVRHHCRREVKPSVQRDTTSPNTFWHRWTFLPNGRHLRKIGECFRISVLPNVRRKFDWMATETVKNCVGDQRSMTSRERRHKYNFGAVLLFLYLWCLSSICTSANRCFSFHCTFNMIVDIAMHHRNIAFVLEVSDTYVVRFFAIPKVTVACEK